MDPFSAVGASASLVQLIGTAAKVIKYLNDIKNAPKERIRLAREVSSLYSVLLELEARYEDSKVESDTKWLGGLRSLAVRDGPMDQLETALSLIMKKLKPSSGIKKLGKALSWPFDKKEIEGILDQIERQKSTINFALQGDQTNLAKAIRANTMQIPVLLDGVQEMQIGVNAIQDYQEIERTQKIVDWLSPLSFSDRYNDILSRSCEGTGQWLIETVEASSWLSTGDKASLWCTGIPGAGKTTIAAIMADHIDRTFANNYDVSVACIYCNYKDKLSQTPVNLLANIWMQIRKSGPLPSDVEDLYSSCVSRGSSTRPRLDNVCKILKTEVNRHDHVFVVIDALDECEPAYRLRLLTELRVLQPKLKLMVTSRYFDAFGADMRIDTDIEVIASEDDIKRYIQERTSSTSRLARWISSDSSLQGTVENKVVEAAQKMFLMAKLLMDSLCTKMTRKALQNSLDDLPKTLNDTYDDALDRIRRQNEDERELAERVLSWISYAFRPLNMMELRHALAVTPGEDQFEEDNMPDEEDIPSVCAGLICIEDGSQIVRLAHYTAQDYLEGIRETSFTYARRLVAATCLTYLSYDGNRLCCGGRHYVFNFSPDGYYKELIDGATTCPFASRGVSDTARDCLDKDRDSTFYHDRNGVPLALYRYAAHYWARHIKTHLEESLEDLAMKFLLSDISRRMALGAIRTLWWISRTSGPLTVMVHYDLRHLSRVLLKKKKFDISDTDGEGHRSLLSAAELGRSHIIRMFLEETNLQSLIDANRNFVLTPLAWVAWTGDRLAVQMLLQSAGILNKDDATPESSHYSIYEAQKLPETRDALIEGIQKMNLPVTLPLIAVLSNTTMLKKALSRKNVDIEERDPTHQKTALHHSAQSGRTGIVEILLEHGADVRARDFYGETPLHYAVDSGNVEVVKLLVNAGSDLSLRNDNGELPTEMLRMRPGDIPCPIHQDELWEETHEFLIEVVTSQKVDSANKRRQFAQRYQGSWREFHRDPEESE